MVQFTYKDSNYKFNDPIRFFKANDPYYFEVDNIPLKQLQENCLWLKDQLREVINEDDLVVKRGDFEELRPYATGGDRVVRVKPGRYSARVNDATSKDPLAYLQKIMGQGIAEIDSYYNTTPGDLVFSENVDNITLQQSLDKFKSVVSENALGMNGLGERAFTWPVAQSDAPINLSGVTLAPGSIFAYGGLAQNQIGWDAEYAPMLITQALLWSRSFNNNNNGFELKTFDYLNQSTGWAKLPKLESYFIKKWRGVSRIAIVDVDSELSISVPEFNSSDFQYLDESGEPVDVANVQSRIDLVFIYSKPVDTSGVTILNGLGKQKITKPQLGIVRGAGIKYRDTPTINEDKDWLVQAAVGNEHRMLASPGDQSNSDMGFTSTSGNDIAYDVRGSFPAPDDILNIAPLLSERLENEAYELVGQSILPVAYVWVQQNSETVLSTDVIDIRPFFRTTELAYNERAGISAAFPQLSFANPAVGKSQLDFEIKNIYDNLNSEIESYHNGGTTNPVIKTGYVFGGWFFGPEGTILNYKKQTVGGNEQDLKDEILREYGYGAAGAIIADVQIPNRPDWDFGKWVNFIGVSNAGEYPNDYWTHFVGQSYYAGGSVQNDDDSGNSGPDNVADGTIVATSYNSRVLDSGLSVQGVTPPTADRFWSFNKRPIYSYVSKTINFQRPSWMKDYHIDCSLINSIIGNSYGQDDDVHNLGEFKGVFVEKGYDSFTIFVVYPGLHYSVVDNIFEGNPKMTSPENYREDPEFMKTGVLLSKFNSGPGVTTGTTLQGNTESFSPGLGQMGLSTYPTISWKMTAIPFGYNIAGNPNSLVGF